jgi:hypothetical protein
VTRRLPEKMREDVASELNSNIYEMLGENYSDEDVKNVLFSLGKPRELSNNYRTSKKNLISEEWMGDYLFTLKIVLIVLGSIGLVFGLVDALSNIQAELFIGVFFEVVSKVISNIINTLLSGFAIVTLIFVLIDINAKKTKEVWNLEDLPEIPKSKDMKLSRAGSITGLVFTVIFGSVWIYILYNSDVYIGWVSYNDSWLVEETLFNLDYTRGFIWLFILSIVFEVIVYLYKIKTGQWDNYLTLIYSISKVFSVVVVVIFLSGNNLINPEFFTFVSETIEMSVDELIRLFGILQKVIIALVIFSNVVDLISVNYKHYKHMIKLG